METFWSTRKMKTLELTNEELNILQDDILTLIEDEEDNNLSRDENYIKELKALYKKLTRRPIPEPNEIYRHFKGNYYKIIAVGHHSETGEQMVVYYDTSKKVSSPSNPCIRPLEMFMSGVDREKYPDVKQKYRFERVEE